MAVYSSTYKDQPAVTLESDTLVAQLLPGTGAKLCSLIYKPRQMELLVQRPAAAYAVQPFDGDYVAGECSGFDDMLPTIDTCYYDRYPWQGVKMADHGEVWSLPYDMEMEDDRLHFSVHGVRFPYRLDKRVSFSAANILHIEYCLTNLSSFDFDFVWAGHMMIYLETGVELCLPDGVQKIVRTFNLGSETAQFGDEVHWPVGQLRSGASRDFRRLRPKSAGVADKYYIKGKMPAGWCGLKYHASNFSLALSFPTETVPYLGVLPNEGGWQDLYNIFLEPCSATFDRPDAARYRGELSTVKAKSTYTWHLNLTLAEGVSFNRVRPDGVLED